MPHIPGHEYSPQRRLSYGRTPQPVTPPVQPVEQDRGFLSNIWDEYLQPGLETAVQLPGVKQTLQGLEAAQQRVVVPAVSRLLEPVPIKFEERPDAPEVSWYDIPGQFGRGDISFNFDQYVTPEGKFSPAALADMTLFNTLPLEVIGENINKDLDLFKPETRRSKNVDDEVKRVEQITKRPVTQVERRKIEEDLYKLPPYTRGIAEELPWVFLPQARVARAGLQATRTGQGLTTAGRLGATAPVARGALRGAELALKPVELIESGMARIIESPFRVTGAVVGRVINRNQIDNISRRGLIYADEVLQDKSYKLPSGETVPPSQKIFEINKEFEYKTGIPNRFNLEQRVDDTGVENFYATFNENAVIPDRVRIRTEEELANIPKEQFRSETLFDERQARLERGMDLDKPVRQDELMDFNFRRPEDMSIESRNRLLAQSPIGNTVDAIGRGLKSNKVLQAIGRQGKKADDFITERINKRFPNVPDWYVKFKNKANDSTSELRALIDGLIERGVNPVPLLRLSKEALINFPSRLTGSTSYAVNRASKRIQNLYTESIDPAIDQGVNALDISNFIRARFQQEILEKFPNRKPPKFEGVDEIITRDVIDDMVNLQSSRYKNYSKTQKDLLVKAADDVTEMYAETRRKLYDKGIISKETYEYFINNYKFYNPITYVEHADQLGSTIVPGKGRNIVDDGIRALDEDFKGKYTQTDPIGETLFQNIIRQEIRLINNENTRVFTRIFEKERGFKDVTDEFLTKKGNYKGKGENKKSYKDLYDDDLKTGYFSFYEDGERFIFGGRDSVKGKPEPIPRDVWEVLNGRAGLNLQSPNEIAQKIAMSNGWFRSMYTTYNPLFWTRNMVIDGLTVWLKTGTMPHKVGMELLRDLSSVATRGEQKFTNLIADLGGWQGDGYVGQAKLQASINKSLQNADQIGSGRVIKSQKDLSNELRNSTLDTAKNVFKKVGGAVESAPRQAVARKAFAKKIIEEFPQIKTDGDKELQRLLNLSKDEYVEEVFSNYKPGGGEGIGKGLVDTDTAIRTAANSLEATLNFSRGGATIKKWNDYILFLNAAMEGAKLPFRALGIDVSPVVRPVKNPVAGGPVYEFGSVKDQIRQALNNLTPGVKATTGATGRIMDNVSGGPFSVAMRLGAIIGTYWAVMEGWNKFEKFNGAPLYYDIPEYIRYNSLIFMLPSPRDEAGDYIIDPKTNRPEIRYLVIPHKLREWNSIFQAVTFFSEESDELDSYQDKSRWMTEVLKSTSPISDIPAPEIFNVGIEQLTGYDQWRNAPIVSEDFQEAPLKEQYSKHTTKTMREMAGIFDTLPTPEPIAKVIASPDRLEHLYESIFGGVGTNVVNMSDYTLSLFDDLRNAEPRPMEEQVEEFRNMNTTERREFMVTLDDKELEEFERELREPETTIPFWDKLLQSFFPQRTGGLERTQQARVDDTFENISVKESRIVSKTLAKTHQQFTQKQKENDDKLRAWMKGKTGEGVLSPSEWREERSSKFDKYEAAVLALGQKYKFSIQAQDEETKQQYYDALHTLAGQDTRTGVELLLSGYYNIKLNETPDSADWDVYNQARDEYLEGIRLKSEANNDNLYNDLIRRIEAGSTELEKYYKKGSDLLSEYWSIGNSLDDLYGRGYSNTNPELNNKWQQYLNADTGTKSQLRRSDQQINTLVQRRSALRKLYVQNSSPDIDGTLAFWYGDFYKPITAVGKQIYTRYYGGQQLFTNVQGIGTTFIPR